LGTHAEPRASWKHVAPSPHSLSREQKTLQNHAPSGAPTSAVQNASPEHFDALPSQYPPTPFAFAFDPGGAQSGGGVPVSDDALGAGVAGPVSLVVPPLLAPDFDFASLVPDPVGAGSAPPHPAIAIAYPNTRAAPTMIFPFMPASIPSGG
jgi:hypothetical protein